MEEEEEVEINSWLNETYHYDGLDPDKVYKIKTIEELQELIIELKLADLTQVHRESLVFHLNNYVEYLIDSILTIIKNEDVGAYKSLSYRHYLIVTKVYSLVRIGWSFAVENCRCDTCLDNADLVLEKFHSSVNKYFENCRYKGSTSTKNKDNLSDNLFVFYQLFKDLYENFHSELINQMQMETLPDVRVSPHECAVVDLHHLIKNLFVRFDHGSKLISVFHKSEKDKEVSLHLPKVKPNFNVSKKNLVHRIKDEEPEEMFIRMSVDDEIELHYPFDVIKAREDLIYG